LANKLDFTGIKVVSFDIFDTALIRKVLKPTDIFQVVADEIGIEGFKNARIAAEKNARKLQPGREDIAYSDIYSLISKEIDPQKELDVEERYLTVNKECYELYKSVPSECKVIFTSDMYLPHEFVSKILHKYGYYYHELYISGSVGKSS